MARAAPLIRSFSAGEFSELMAGRVDIDRYASSSRLMLNAVAAPQGPFISRSGTQLVNEAYDSTKFSNGFAFIASNEEPLFVEVAEDRFRFASEDGLLTYAAVALNPTNIAGAPIVFTSVPLGGAIGDQVFLSGFPSNYGLNNTQAKIVNKVGNVYTLDVNYPAAVAVVAGTASRIYHVPHTLTLEQRQNVRPVQSVDVAYLLFSKGRTQKLSRYDTYDWRLSPVVFRDGPYLPINDNSTYLTFSATGNAIPNMTANNAPSGLCVSSSDRPAIAGTPGAPVAFLGRNLTYALAASAAYYAFDNSDLYWAANAAQAGTLRYNPVAPFVCDGYSIHVAKENTDGTFSSSDYAPSSFTFEGFDGVNWIVLDKQTTYVLYDNRKSVFFEINNTVAYQAYRLNINELVRNGSIEPRVNRFILRDANRANIAVTASAVQGINFDQGFKATDVGRLLRAKGNDGAWRSFEIKTYTSPTQVGVKLLGEPLLDVTPIREWRLGAWSDTTGWPVCGDFVDDRLLLAGGIVYPDSFGMSVVGDYENFKQTDDFGVVLDDSAIYARLNARKQAAIRWVAASDKGTLLGTGSEEYTLVAPDQNSAISARNIKSRVSTRRGSANVEPVKVDTQILFVQRGGRTVREHAFVFEADGYKSPSMSQLSSHIGVKGFTQLEYAAEPHSLIWALRTDGTVAAMTYYRDEDVVGWHQHDFSGAVVEAIVTLPQFDQLQDTLWIIARRNVNGVTKRYIERLTRFWDFGMTVTDAFFVDCGSRYVGAPTNVIYGMGYLEGEQVYGLADGVPVGPLTVTNDKVTLPVQSSNVVLGLGYDSVGELPNIEAGAQDGTAQGKTKRVNAATVFLWDSFGGEVGKWNDDRKEWDYERIEIDGNYDEVNTVTLFTGASPTITVAPGYDKYGRLAVRRQKDSPLPFNVTAIAPRIDTQDG